MSDENELTREDRARLYAAKLVRPGWDEYFMELAKTVSSRSTCPKRRVGSVLVDSGKHVVSTGYNGSPPGLPHCVEAGCILEGGKCVRTIHAEINALVHGEPGRLRDGAAYCTTMPCWTCFKALLAAGVRRVVYADPGTPDELVAEYAAQSEVVLKLMPESTTVRRV